MAVTSRDLSGIEGDVSSPPALRAGAGTIAIALMAALFGPYITVAAVVDDDTGGAGQGLRVVAWNLRMGYGMDGEFDPRAVAAQIADQAPDVVLLSEVDRAWLLNGGQDQLAILALLLAIDRKIHRLN